LKGRIAPLSAILPRAGRDAGQILSHDIPEQAVARKKQPITNFVMFDVIYQDGTRSSHRKVPAAEPHEHDFEARVKATIEAQDREIAEKSGRPRGPIKSIVKSAGQ
jgi:hypothetical protein